MSPTGGVIEGKQELINAYTTGKGKVVLKADCEIINEIGKIFFEHSENISQNLDILDQYQS